MNISFAKQKVLAEWYAWGRTDHGLTMAAGAVITVYDNKITCTYSGSSPGPFPLRPVNG